MQKSTHEMDVERIVAHTLALIAAPESTDLDGMMLQMAAELDGDPEAPAFVSRFRDAFSSMSNAVASQARGPSITAWMQVTSPAEAAHIADSLAAGDTAPYEQRAQAVAAMLEPLIQQATMMEMPKMFAAVMQIEDPNGGVFNALLQGESVIADRSDGDGAVLFPKDLMR